MLTTFNKSLKHLRSNTNWFNQLLIATNFRNMIIQKWDLQLIPISRQYTSGLKRRTGFWNTLACTITFAWRGEELSGLLGGRNSLPCSYLLEDDLLNQLRYSTVLCRPWIGAVLSWRDLWDTTGVTVGDAPLTSSGPPIGEPFEIV